jgi:hypothetical protein
MILDNGIKYQSVFIIYSLNWRFPMQEFLRKYVPKGLTTRVHVSAFQKCKILKPFKLPSKKRIISEGNGASMQYHRIEPGKKCHSSGQSAVYQPKI